MEMPTNYSYSGKKREYFAVNSVFLRVLCIPYFKT